MIFKALLGLGIGGGLGFAYYYFIGCNSGSCAIQSNPYYATIYGGVMGVLIAFWR
ncbi:MAG: DUF6132 family protein [Spirochaetota bacterium]|nr:DUF6132 family protein [Spirochaetota bacterium]